MPPEHGVVSSNLTGRAIPQRSSPDTWVSFFLVLRIIAMFWSSDRVPGIGGTLAKKARLLAAVST